MALPATLQASETARPLRRRWNLPVTGRSEPGTLVRQNTPLDSPLVLGLIPIPGRRPENRIAGSAKKAHPEVAGQRLSRLLQNFLFLAIYLTTTASWSSELKKTRFSSRCINVSRILCYTRE
jgi:hypothetical protein